VSALDALGLEAPVVQAGMGGGISRHELAAAVSEAGGLGTIAVNGAESIRREVEAARGLTGRPIAVNLLLPFARRDSFEAAAAADVVVTFWGAPRRPTGAIWLHQCGSLAEARVAHAAGADGVILQGVEAGGHARGTTPALGLLAEARAALPAGFPLLLAGGIATAADSRRALAAGADAVVAGTRFLLAEESRAHRDYKRRLIGADETILTDLFGFGWPAPHRVVANAATARALRNGHPPAVNRALNRLSGRGARFVPQRVQAQLAARQRPGGILLGPVPATDDGPPGLVDSGPLYAGETVARIEAVRSAADLVRELAP
jgi:NAD(P)H-dependent flavin oxidoreductase YrpB (nitropropane dioxygenase family)